MLFYPLELANRKIKKRKLKNWNMEFQKMKNEKSKIEIPYLPKRRIEK